MPRPMFKEKRDKFIVFKVSRGHVSQDLYKLLNLNMWLCVCVWCWIYIYLFGGWNVECPMKMIAHSTYQPAKRYVYNFKN